VLVYRSGSERELVKVRDALKLLAGAGQDFQILIGAHHEGRAEARRLEVVWRAPTPPRRPLPPPLWDGIPKRFDTKKNEAPGFPRASQDCLYAVFVPRVYFRPDCVTCTAQPVLPVPFVQGEAVSGE
jgi:hypothetical protein